MPLAQLGRLLRNKKLELAVNAKLANEVLGYVGRDDGKQINQIARTHRLLDLTSRPLARSSTCPLLSMMVTMMVTVDMLDIAAPCSLLPTSCHWRSHGCHRRSHGGHRRSHGCHRRSHGCHWRS